MLLCRCEMPTNSYSRLRISFIFEELFKPTDKFYSKFCLDPLEQNLCSEMWFKSMKYTMMMFIVSLGKLIGITPSWRKRICGQINLEYVVLRKAKLYWRFLRTFSIKIFLNQINLTLRTFKYLVSHWSLFCVIFFSLHNIICKFHVRYHIILLTGRRKISFCSRDLYLKSCHI